MIINNVTNITVIHFTIEEFNTLLKKYFHFQTNDLFIY